MTGNPGTSILASRTLLCIAHVQGVDAVVSLRGANCVDLALFGAAHAELYWVRIEQVRSLHNVIVEARSL